VRCFLAIEIPDDVRAALAQTQASLRRRAPRADLRWLDPAGLHVTLKFLGEVPEDALPAVADAVRKTAAAHAAIPLALAGLGGFPSLKRARVLWAGLATGVAELGRLAVALERALEPLGFPPESRPFRGHVTFARVRSPRGLGRITAAIEATPDVAFGNWTAGDVILYRSHLRPTGATYEPLAIVPLAG